MSGRVAGFARAARSFTAGAVIAAAPLTEAHQTQTGRLASLHTDSNRSGPSELVGAARALDAEPAPASTPSPRGLGLPAPQAAVVGVLTLVGVAVAAHLRRRRHARA